MCNHKPKNYCICIEWTKNGYHNHKYYGTNNFNIYSTTKEEAEKEMNYLKNHPIYKSKSLSVKDIYECDDIETDYIAPIAKYKKVTK